MNTSLAWASPSEIDPKFVADLSFSKVEDALEFASHVLWSLSGRKYGPIKVTTEAYDTRSTLAQGSQVYPTFMNGKPYNVSSCGSCKCTGCGVFHRTRLRGYPVRTIFEVWINGCSLPRNDYVLLDNSVLGLTSGESCGANCIVVKYAYGSGVPPGGKNAAIKLAEELLESARGGDCSLPERVTSVSRQGMSWTLLDPQDFLEQGRTGIYEIDLLLHSLNPTRALMRPRVFSPDLERATTYQYDPPPMSLLVGEEDQVIMHGYPGRFVSRNQAVLSAFMRNQPLEVVLDNGMVLQGHWYSFVEPLDSVVLDLEREEVDKIPHGMGYAVMSEGREIARGTVRELGDTYLRYPTLEEQEIIADSQRGVRSVHVSTGTGNEPKPGGPLPRSGDIHINVTTGESFYYDPTTYSWKRMGGQRADNTFWGRGRPMTYKKDTYPNPVEGESLISSDDGKLYTHGRAGQDWVEQMVKDGDEYIDIDTGTVFELKASG